MTVGTDLHVQKLVVQLCGKHKSSLLQDQDSEVGHNNGKTDRSRCLSSVAVLLSIISLILASTLGLILFMICSSEKGHFRQSFIPETTEEDAVSPFACISCIKLLRDPMDDIASDPLLRKLDIEVTDGLEVCCAYSSEQITALFESIVRLNDSPQQFLASYNLSDFTFSPVSAHKMLYPERLSRDFSVPEFPEQPQVCELKEDDTRYGLEHHRGVNITKKGLRIVHGGLYYIYSSIQFRPQSIHPCHEFKYQTFVAYVEKISYRHSASQLILKFSHTCCDVCVNTQETRFTGGVFILDPGDLIRIKVMGYRLVYFQPETSFMGLAMLGSTPEKKSLASEASNSI
ncbi:hypothetical protein RRG08_025301 [Elysia crispata]|uniref:THD domain-containing protein n=1 Tax=Elysia crispata TaxID=231223 RepID=A0AAE1DUX7_9GAST|nr:hypothetical protein RRG08_025301 [Elysia crispata]